MNKSLLLIFSIILTSYGCDFKTEYSKYKNSCITYYHKIKVTLGIEEKGSFILDKVNYTETASSDEEMKKALQEFAEADADTEQTENVKTTKPGKTAKTDTPEKTTDTMSGLKREITMLRFENERLRTEIEEKNGIVFHNVSNVMPTRAPASMYYPQTTVNDLSADELYKIAETFLKKGKYKGAKSYFNKIVTKFPENQLTSMSYFWLGEIAVIQKDHIAAIEAYREAAYTTDANEKKASSFYKIALSYKAIGKLDFARQYFEKVLNVLPESKYGEFALKELTAR